MALGDPAGVVGEREVRITDREQAGTGLGPGARRERAAAALQERREGGDVTGARGDDAPAVDADAGATGASGGNGANGG